MNHKGHEGSQRKIGLVYTDRGEKQNPYQRAQSFTEDVNKSPNHKGHEGSQRKSGLVYTDRGEKQNPYQRAQSFTEGVRVA
jgi:hypothetical protein